MVVASREADLPQEVLPAGVHVEPDDLLVALRDLLGPYPGLGEAEGGQEGLEPLRRGLDGGRVERDVAVVAQPFPELGGAEGGLAREAEGEVRPCLHREIDPGLAPLHGHPGRADPRPVPAALAERVAHRAQVGVEHVLVQDLPGPGPDVLAEHRLGESRSRSDGHRGDAGRLAGVDDEGDVDLDLALLDRLHLGLAVAVAREQRLDGAGRCGQPAGVDLGSLRQGRRGQELGSGHGQGAAGRGHLHRRRHAAGKALDLDVHPGRGGRPAVGEGDDLDVGELAGLVEGADRALHGPGTEGLARLHRQERAQRRRVLPGGEAQLDGGHHRPGRRGRIGRRRGPQEQRREEPQGAQSFHSQRSLKSAPRSPPETSVLSLSHCTWMPARSLRRYSTWAFWPRVWLERGAW